jgi:hypothetical protein
MAIHQGASRITASAFPAGSLTLTVANGQPIRVHGIKFTNTSGGALVVTINNGSGTKITDFDIADAASDEWSVPAMWDAGLQIVSSGAGLGAVVFHDNPGN